jgi:hypothetical protein
MAGVPGFEPGMAVPKTAALPLGYTPLCTASFSDKSQRYIKLLSKGKPLLGQNKRKTLKLSRGFTASFIKTLGRIFQKSV